MVSYSLIDYVAIPCWWLPFVTDVQTIREIDDGTLHDDHWPVALCLQKHPTKVWKRSATIPLSEAKLHCPGAVQAFEAELDASPIPPWHVPVDIHYSHWVATLGNAARRHLTDRARGNLGKLLKQSHRHGRRYHASASGE